MPPRLPLRNTTKSKVQSTQQHIYATNLQQNLGYPLRNPRPNQTLDEPYRSEGFQIGDIGHVDQYGEFKLLFNISFPPEELSLDSRDKAELKQPIASQMVAPNMVFKTGVEENDLGDSRNDERYKFTATSRAGAILILPTGARLFELEDQYMGDVRSHIIKHAPEWCKIYQKESLYLITAVYKAKSWTLGSFDNGSAGGEIYVFRNHDDNGVQYTWRSAFNVDSQQGPKVRRHHFLVEKRLEAAEGWLARLLADLQLKAGKWLSGQKIEYFPALNFSQPSHPLDVVNNVLLDKNPGAQMAVTHDNEWIEMLNDGLEFSKLMEERPLRDFMERKYICDLDSKRDNVVYLRSNLQRSTGYDRQLSPDLPDEMRGECKPDEDLVAPIDDSRLVITNMRLESFGVDHIDAGVCVLVRFGTTTRRTTNKPHASIIEWDDEIMLPSGLPVYITVCGTFQLGSTFGTREMSERQTIYTSDLSGSTYKIRFPVGNAESRASLLITLERHFSYCEIHSGHEEKSVFAEKTTLAFEAFYSHYMEHQKEDLETALECFRVALTQCDTNSARRATACFNLATSEFIRCQANGIYSALKTPIDLYREALEQRGDGHPDRPATLLLLAQALLSRHGGQYDESVVDEIERLLADLHRDNSRDRQTADAIIATCRFYRAINSENPTEVDGLLGDLERGVYEPPYGYFDRPHMVHILGLAFWRRFQALANLEDLDKSIRLNAEALPFVPDGHDDRKGIIDCLGNSFLCGIEAREELTDLDISIGLAEVGKKVLAKLDDASGSSEGAQAPSEKLQKQKELTSAADTLWEKIEEIPADKLHEQIELLFAVERLRDQIELTSSADKLRKQISRMTAADYALRALVKQDLSTHIPEIQSLVEDWNREDGTPTECKRQLGVLLSFLDGEGDTKMRQVLERLDFEWSYKEHKITNTVQALQAHRPYFNSVLTTQMRCLMEGWP